MTADRFCRFCGVNLVDIDRFPAEDPITHPCPWRDAHEAQESRDQLAEHVLDALVNMESMLKDPGPLRDIFDSLRQSAARTLFPDDEPTSALQWP